MNDVKTGTFTASASAVNVETGFIPSAVLIVDRATPSLSLGVIGSGDNGVNIAAAAAAEAGALAAWAGEGPLTDLTGTLAATVGGVTVTGTSTLFTTELVVGEDIQINGHVYKVAAIASATSLTLSRGIEATVTAAKGQRVQGRGEGFTVPAAFTANTTGTCDYIAYR